MPVPSSSSSGPSVLCSLYSFLRWLSLLMTFINKCWKLLYQSKPWCVKMHAYSVKSSLVSTSKICWGERQRRNPKHTNVTVRTSTQSGHSHISNYLLEYSIAISKHLNTNSSISLQKSGPLPAASVTVSGVLLRINLALLFSHQNITSYPRLIKAYLHHPLLYLQPHFLINCYHQSPDQVF